LPPYPEEKKTIETRFKTRKMPITSILAITLRKRRFALSVVEKGQEE